ncbi:ribonuclease III [Zhihengliuella flava]|uniref:Ribonuclease 3 n=1 Tax=Zhihengliuella flava TaxID=1285193 RepID=A0A931GKH7_9MICC|nr:ribonuclease III [Zhihengliuella flava]MBG6083524.1 ribonuclease-3 [Zhihengliuella flava]
MPASEDLLKRLGVTIDSETLRLALTHRSYAYEHGGIPTNERLEFLGDSVLGFTVTEYLYHRYPDLPEGDLAKRRAAVVSTRALARVARELGLGPYVFLGEGEKRTNGADKSSILADTTEAIIGAAFLSCGTDAAKEMVLRLVIPLIDEVENLGAGIDWKTAIQEVAAARKLGAIRYVVEGDGPDHARVFTATLTIGGDSYGSGTGPSKKEAEQEAAAVSWRQLNPDQKAQA